MNMQEIINILKSTLQKFFPCYDAEKGDER